MNQVVFRIKSYPSFGFDGSVCGDCVTVYEDGTVTRCSFIFDKVNDPYEETVIGSVPDAVEELLHYFDIRRYSLDSIPEYLSNGSLDGDMDVFEFGSKRVVSHNIVRNDPEEIQKNNILYYVDYKDNIKHENLVLDIYDKVKEILIEHGLDIEFPVNR